MPTWSICSAFVFRQITVSNEEFFAFKYEVIGNIMLKFFNHKAPWG